MGRCISLLGSTGSIGRQTLDVAEKLGVGVCALTAGSNVDRMEAQCRAFRPKLAVMATPELAEQLAQRLGNLPVEVRSGKEGLLAAATMEEADTVITAVVGMVGLEPTPGCHPKGKADWPCQQRNPGVRRGAGDGCCGPVWGGDHPGGLGTLCHFPVPGWLPGPGAGPALDPYLLRWPLLRQKAEELRYVTRADALCHPNWRMGAKITIDCATLMNKGLELIEAMRLYRLPMEQVSVVIHRQSVVHSLVEYVDGAVLAQLGAPDMRLPIQLALTWPDRAPCPAPDLDLLSCGPLTFDRPDLETFPLPGSCYGGSQGRGYGRCGPQRGQRGGCGAVSSGSGGLL